VGASVAGFGVLAVDILPTALPRGASAHFGDKLLPILMVTTPQFYYFAEVGRKDNENFAFFLFLSHLSLSQNLILF